MSRFDRDLATLRDLVERRRANPVSIRREDLATERERTAFDIWRFLWVQYEMAPEEEEEPYAYGEVLALVGMYEDDAQA